MPYRRLPKTDQARLKSLKKAIAMERMPMSEIPVPFRLLTQAKAYLPVFETLVNQYNMTFETQVTESKKYQNMLKNARMYVSHFIQVLNFAVLRGEFKKDIKVLYGLDPDDYTVPDLTTDAALVVWGRKIIDGEQERVAQGGAPLAYPTIAKVRVHYDIFCEHHTSRKTYQQSTNRNQQRVAEMRDQVDELILQIWDAIEATYVDLLPYARYQACTKCGVIYYYRKGEKHLTPKIDEDIEKAQAATLSLSFEE